MRAGAERPLQPAQIMRTDRFPLAPGFVLGIAVAGFFDGIVLHQILQWHHMICIETQCATTSVAALQRETLTDGLFHAAMLVVLLIALVSFANTLARGARFSRPRFWGSALFGGGVFNVVEGIVDHHILQIHHVRFGPGQTPWDIGFLIVSAVLLAIGWAIAWRHDSAASASSASPARR
jgi:uncharacterized membrane protein